MKQMSIITETRKRYDKLYIHELEIGDVFCFTSKEIQKRECYVVTDSDFEQDMRGDYSGELKYYKKEYSNKIGKGINVAKSTKDATKTAFFIRKGIK